jgi:flavin reductase (DIM6/NTAB) family NADH-FMN oxidoreductase RutF
MHILCKVVQKIPLGSHDMFLAEITGVVADEEYLDKKGKLRMDRMHLLAYSHGEYFTIGKRVGTFGFSVRKKPPKGKNLKNK